MRLIIKGLVCVVLVWLLGNQMASAQSFHQLTVDDFEGRPETNGIAIAYTDCSIDMHYHVTAEDGNYRLAFDIRLILNRDKCWIDRSRVHTRELLAEILKHEQGHYTIAYMEQQEVLREMGRTHFGSDYQTRVKEIFNRIDNKYKQLNIDYDEDTQHMNDRRQQHSWDVFFYRRLKYMPQA
jgi:hypothetical protein